MLRSGREKGLPRLSLTFPSSLPKVLCRHVELSLLPGKKKKGTYAQFTLLFCECPDFSITHPPVLFPPLCFFPSTAPVTPCCVYAVTECWERTVTQPMQVLFAQVSECVSHRVA